ncbi:SH3 domain-containing protein [Candidatus Marinimicrobia bacterium]|nr:SH3 domain-containing protein [Candidatus Neomarinimicrobiota bacterium]
MLLSIVATQSSDSLFQLGNTYYENEQYETAASTYEQLENDYSHEYLYLNLGNSYYRMGELGNAVWAYEKAYSIAPRDQDIIYNLNFVRSQVRDRIIPPDNFFIFSLYTAFLDKTTILDISVLGGLLFIIISIIYLMNSYLLIPEKLNSIINSTLIFTLVFLIWVSVDKYWKFTDINEAIVISTSVDVRSAPIQRGENVVFRVHEGTKAQITAVDSGWYEIILLDGKKGWLSTQDMRKL